MSLYYVPEKGLKDWDKVLIVKQTLEHIVFEETTVKYDDLISKKINDIKDKYYTRKQDEEVLRKRNMEIQCMLQNELLSNNKKSELINELNDNKFKYFGDNDDELYESISIAFDMYLCWQFGDPTASVDMIAVYYELIKDYINKILRKPNEINDEVRIEYINEILAGLKYCENIAVKRLNLKTSKKPIILALNAIILKLYDDICVELLDDLIIASESIGEKELNKYLKYYRTPNGVFINMYSLFMDLLVGVDVDELIKYYPIEKSFEDYGCKNYWSSKEIIDKYRNGNFEINHKQYYLNDNKIPDRENAMFLFGEILFSEPWMFDIQLEMFYIIEYGTDINSIDLMFEFLNETDSKPKLKVIK